VPRQEPGSLQHSGNVGLNCGKEGRLINIIRTTVDRANFVLRNSFVTRPAGPLSDPRGERAAQHGRILPSAQHQTCLVIAAGRVRYIDDHWISLIQRHGPCIRHHPHHYRESIFPVDQTCLELLYYRILALPQRLRRQFRNCCLILSVIARSEEPSRDQRQMNCLEIFRDSLRRRPQAAGRSMDGYLRLVSRRHPPRASSRPSHRPLHRLQSRSCSGRRLRRPHPRPLEHLPLRLVQHHPLGLPRHARRWRPLRHLDLPPHPPPSPRPACRLILGPCPAPDASVATGWAKRVRLPTPEERR
jgi:hypothetical protein